MHKDERVEYWATLLTFGSWDNVDELAKIIVAEIDSEGE